MPPERHRTVRDDLVSPWPNETQELLLRATLLPDERAGTDWLRWLDRFGLDEAGPAESRLFPETYSNLASIGFRHPSLQTLKELHQKTWLENQFLLHQVEGGLAALHQAGIPTMLLKGVALLLNYYGQYGRRPMADLDIVVPTEYAERARGILLKAGYRLDEEATRGHRRELLHAATFVSETGRQIDLHWHVMFGCRDDRPFWESATPVRLGDLDTLVPGPTELLIHVCVHGIYANPVPPIRWLVDSAVIIRGGQVDWERLIEIADRLRYSFRLSKALDYITRFDVTVPPDVVARLAARDRFGFERIEFEQVTWTRPKGVATQIAATKLSFDRFAVGSTGLQRLMRVPEFLKFRWGLDRIWQLPSTAVRKVAARTLRKDSVG